MNTRKINKTLSRNSRKIIKTLEQICSGVNWIGILILFGVAILLSIFSMGFSGDIICSINRMVPGCLYGTFWGRMTMFIIFYFIMNDIKLTRSIENK
jgi:hypothetical protein